MELVKIKAEDYGIQETKAKEIADQFKPMLSKMEALESEYNEVIQLPIENPYTAEKAKELRLKYVKVRTGTAEIHKAQKAFYLAGGRFVDGWKNAQVFASQGKEQALMDIEKHQENIEKERVIKLQKERVILLSQFVEDAAERDLSGMDLDVWTAYLTTKEKAYNDQIEAEKKAEQDRIAKEKAEKAERERVIKENAKLKAEAEERERLAKIEADKRKKEDEKRIAKQEAERKERERLESIEKAKHEAELKKQREELAKAQEAQRVASKQLQEKQEAERKSAQEAEARKQQELSKGDAAKVSDLINDLTSLKTKYDFKSAKNKKMYADTCIWIDKVLNHIK